MTRRTDLLDASQALGATSLVGGAGNDLYRFDIGSARGADLLVETTDGGLDTLDFSLTTDASRAVVLDLSLARAQVVNANLTLTLGSADGFENAIGGAGHDRLTGNDLDNELTASAATTP